MAEEQVKEAEAALNIAKANAEQKAMRHQDIESAKARVSQAEAAVELAKANVARKVMSQDDIETVRAQRKQAEASARSARSQMAQLKISEAEVQAARAAVAQARAALSFAREQLGNTRITSPVSGVVSRRFADLGEMVAPGTPILEVTSMNTVYFQGTLSEMEVSQVHVGQAVDVTVDAVPGVRFSGKVTEVVPVADTESHNFAVKVSVPASSQLKPGSFARGTIVVSLNPAALLLPKQALVQGAGKQVVFVVVGNKATSRAVEVNGTAREQVAILSGVSATDRVVVRGASSLRDGDEVRAVETTTDKATPNRAGGPTPPAPPEGGGSR